MGMYTEFSLHGLRFKKDNPTWVERTVRFMGGEEVDGLPEDWEGFHDHDLFKTPRWRYMIGRMRIDEYDGLSCEGEFKNYNDEIALFLDWIYPFVYPGYPKFVGWYQYEESENPTLIYWDRESFKEHTVNFLPEFA